MFDMHEIDFCRRCLSVSPGMDLPPEVRIEGHERAPKGWPEILVAHNTRRVLFGPRVVANLAEEGVHVRFKAIEVIDESRPRRKPGTYYYIGEDTSELAKWKLDKGRKCQSCGGISAGTIDIVTTSSPDPMLFELPVATDHPLFVASASFALLANKYSWKGLHFRCFDQVPSCLSDAFSTKQPGSYFDESAYLDPRWNDCLRSLMSDSAPQGRRHR